MVFVLTTHRRRPLCASGQGNPPRFSPIMFFPYLAASLTGQSSELPGGWKVADATGRVLADCYGDGRPKGASDSTLTVDGAARRGAAGIARLLGLLRPGRHPAD